MIPKLYCPISFPSHGTIALSEEEHHHLRHVLRAKRGDLILLINGSGQGATGKLVKCTANKTWIQIHALFEEPSPNITLAVGISRFSHLEWTIEKGTELGASNFWLFPGEKSVKKELTENQMDRLRKLSIAAMKQSGRLTLPDLLFKEPLKAWQRQATATQLFADPDPTAPFLWESNHHISSSTILYIGPEGGWSSQERKLLKEYQRAHQIRLHTHILRTETAVVAGLAILQSLLKMRPNGISHPTSAAKTF